MDVSKFLLNGSNITRLLYRYQEKWQAGDRTLNDSYPMFETSRNLFCSVDLKAALHSVPWQPSRAFHRLVLWLACLGLKGLVVCNNNQQRLPLARLAAVARSKKSEIGLLRYIKIVAWLCDLGENLNRNHSEVKRKISIEF